jgi:hypothetical protein
MKDSSTSDYKNGERFKMFKSFNVPAYPNDK